MTDDDIERAELFAERMVILRLVRLLHQADQAIKLENKMLRRIEYGHGGERSARHNKEIAQEKG